MIKIMTVIVIMYVVVFGLRQALFLKSLL